MFWPPLSQYLKIFRKGKNKKANDAQLKKEKGICYAVLRKYSNNKKRNVPHTFFSDDMMEVCKDKVIFLQVF